MGKLLHHTAMTTATITRKGSLQMLVVAVAMVLGGVVGWLKYFVECERSRDYATDLLQVVHDYDLTAADLRRSLERDEIARRVDDA